VIGDANRTELRLARELREVTQGNAAVARILGVHVHVEADAVHRRECGAVRMPPANSA